MPAMVPKPARAEKTRPAKSGSEKILRKGMVAHMYKGCLPSDKGRNRSEGSARMT